MSMKHFRQRLCTLLEHVPKSWLGTTYPNDGRYVGRKNFIDEMLSLLSGQEPIEQQKLALFFPEDYVRLGSPLSTLLEMLRALEKGYQPHNVFSFASRTLPLLSVLLSATSPVYIYGSPIFSSVQDTMLKELYGCDFKYCSDEPQSHGDGVVVELSDKERKDVNSDVDAVVGLDGLLYIMNPEKILLNDLKDKKGKIIQESIHTIRKRFGGPIPTPDALAILRDQALQETPDTKAFKSHLKQLAGCPDALGDPLVTTTGLASLVSCTMAAVELGNRNIDVLMASTAYGGSAQQTEILAKQCGITKHTFGIQGKDGHVLPKISEKLQAMKSGEKRPLTIVLLEYPTNPDMKDCDLSGLETVLVDYQSSTDSKVALILDTTFSPPSMVLKGLFMDFPVIVWNSLSKSVSGGFTTGGSLVANGNAFAQQWLKRANAHADLLDVHAKACQLQIFVDKHSEMENRVKLAHKYAVDAAKHLEEVVQSYSNQTMKVNFVTPVQIKKGVTPATFSFNLPAPDELREDGTALAALGQDFVDHLVSNYSHGVKPCVSFGQNNSIVYVTVPATSTQGVISEEVKAKQAVGGVKLVRFSFPPHMDLDGFNKAIDATVQHFYRPTPALKRQKT